jgi:hypothetical protein
MLKVQYVYVLEALVLCLVLQEQLNSAMSNLMTDNDRDVAHAARCLHATFKRTPLRMTGGAGLLDMNGSSSGTGVCGQLCHVTVCVCFCQRCASLMSAGCSKLGYAGLSYACRSRLATM